MANRGMNAREFRRRLVAGSFRRYSRVSAAMLGLQFVQADPIRSPARAQDLILRQRVDGYHAGDLEKEYPELEVEEGFLFAYGFMTSDVWRNLRWRGTKGLSATERVVLEAVREIGEAHPRDLDERFGRKLVRNAWGGQSLATKRMLEELQDRGYLRVSRRRNGIRVYQVPEQTDEAAVDPRLRYSRLVLTTIHVFGPVEKSFLITELGHLNHMIPDRKKRVGVVDQLLDSGRLADINVEGSSYLWKEADWESEDVSSVVRFLSPFDPLVRDRQRFERLWGWRYRFEAYVPAAKRERGYYAMPLLWGEQVIGWVNAAIEGERLRLDTGFVGERPAGKGFRRAFEDEAEAMASFLGLESGAWEWTHRKSS